MYVYVCRDVVDGIFEPTWCSLTEGNCALALATFYSKCFLDAIASLNIYGFISCHLKTCG